MLVKMWDSLCNGVLNIVFLWVMLMLLGLFFGINQEERFIVIWWVVATIIVPGIIILTKLNSTKANVQHAPKKYLNTKHIQKIGETVEKLAKIEHEHIDDRVLKKTCEMVRNHVAWICDNNTIDKATQIDERMKLISDIVSDTIKVYRGGNQIT